MAGEPTPSPRTMHLDRSDRGSAIELAIGRDDAGGGLLDLAAQDDERAALVDVAQHDLEIGERACCQAAAAAVRHTGQYECGALARCADRTREGALPARGRARADT